MTISDNEILEAIALEGKQQGEYYLGKGSRADYSDQQFGELVEEFISDNDVSIDNTALVGNILKNYLPDYD